MPRLFASALLALLLVTGCAEPDTDPMTPPDGWTGTGTERWWQEGTDTTGVFPDLDTFQSMGIERPGDPLAAQVQRGLLAYYRYQPRYVDSLFQAIAEPMVARTEVTPNMNVRALRTDVYRQLGTRFRIPQASQDQTIGVDIPYVYPDSLAGTEGMVWMQLYLNAEGVPVAIERMTSVHPTLDALAMQIATQRRFVPAYLNGTAVPAWFRFGVPYPSTYRSPEEEPEE